MASNPFLYPATRVQHARLCAAEAFRYAEEKATRGVTEHPDAEGLHAMSLADLVREIRDEAADQTIYAAMAEKGILEELERTLGKLRDELDGVEECEAQLEGARVLVRKALRLVR